MIGFNNSTYSMIALASYVPSPVINCFTKLLASNWWWVCFWFRKYLLLFVISSTSSILVLVLQEATHNMSAAYFYVFDQWLNILCLYWQFQHISYCYDFGCKYPDLCCRKCVGYKVTRWQKRNVKLKYPMASISMASSTTSQQSTDIEVTSRDRTSAVQPMTPTNVHSESSM